MACMEHMILGLGIGCLTCILILACTERVFILAANQSLIFSRNVTKNSFVVKIAPFISKEKWKSWKLMHQNCTVAKSRCHALHHRTIYFSYVLLLLLFSLSLSLSLSLSPFQHLNKMLKTKQNKWNIKQVPHKLILTVRSFLSPS